MKKLICFILILSTAVGVLSSCSTVPYDYDISEYLTVPADWNNVSVNDKAIDLRKSEAIRDLVRSYATEKEVIGSPAEIGHKLKISFLCYSAADYGKDTALPIDILSDDDCTLIIGNLKYPYELEMAAVGHYINDKFTARTTLSHDIGLEEYAGAHVVFDATVISITEIAKPAYNEEFVRAATGFKTVEEFEEAMREKARYELIFEQILEKAEISVYPENELATYERNYIDYYTKAASAAECTLDEYVAKKFFMTMPEFHKEANSYSKDMVKKDLLLYYFVRMYNLTPTNEEYKSYAEKYAREQRLDSVSALETKFGEPFIRKSASYEKLLDFLGKNVPPSPDAEQST